MGVLDFIFPKYCVNCKKVGSYLCDNCFAFLSFDEGNICIACNKASIDGLTHPICRSKYVIDGVFSALAYKKTVKKLVYSFKYKPYVSDLGNLMVELFYEGIIQKQAFMEFLEKKPVFTSIPLHSSKLKSRGYNHANILGVNLAKKFNLSYEETLKRIKKTSSRFGLDRKQRKENIKGAFAILSDKEEAIRDKHIILVDDILTTGTTMLEASKILKKAGAKAVFGLALARD